MRGSVDKLRWGLAGGAVGLVLLLVAFVGYGRYKAVRDWKSRLDKLGIHVERETDGYTFSQSLQGRTTLTLHAAKAIEHKNGKLTLHDVVVTLYGRHNDRFDRISGAEFEYDDKSGVARAVGEVHMDIRAPGAFAKSSGVSAPQNSRSAAEGVESDPRDIHVRTSGLVFVRKLGVAATDQQVEFRYAGLQCTAKGAEFDSGESTVHLLADVHVDGQLRGKPMALRASKADLNRDTNIIALAAPQVSSEGRKAQAANAVLHLRKDGSIETAKAGGGVLFEQGTRRLKADHLEASLSGGNLPEHARLLGGITVDDTAPTRLLHGSTAELEGTFDAAGAPANWIAVGGVQIQTASRNAEGQIFTRNLHGDRMEAQFKAGIRKGTSRLAELRVLGSAMAIAESPASASGAEKGSERKTVQVAADNLRAVFAPSGRNTPEVRQVFGEGHTSLQQDAPRGEQQISTGDRLELALAPGEKQGGSPRVVSAVQTGHVEVQSRSAAKVNDGPAAEPVFAKADRSYYDAAAGKLLLAGSTQFTQGGLSITSTSATVDQRSGDSDAEGNVVATVLNTQHREAEATHVRADAAHLQRGSQVVDFRGSDARPVRLWQGASQVEAATLLLDGKRKTLAARPGSPKGTIRAVFAGNSAPPRGGTDKFANPLAGDSRQVTNVAANRMDYDNGARTATFDGDVHVSGVTGQVQAQHAVAFLGQRPATAPATVAPAKAEDALLSPFGGSLQKVVIWGDVHLNQPGRIARGERLVYSSADSSFVLTGTPAKLPQVVDAERGSITGAALLFRTGDNTVIVSGALPAPGAPAKQGGRVRTEMGAKQ